ncbi:MAG TPA: thiamine pyrophosphate-dependent enzyme, partial [Pirellulales bacterium]
AARPSPPPRTLPLKPKRCDQTYQLKAEAPITISRLVARLNESLTDDTAVIADVGDALFAASELCVRTRTTFISPAYYTSMGFAVPAALGVHVANQKLRAIAIVGDGAFQMTCTELSTIVRHGFPSIVIVLDNRGYGTERALHPGNFNDINPWKYHRLPGILNGGTGYEVRTEGEFDEALRRALADTSGMSLIQAHIGLDDHSSALRRLADRLSKRV